MHALLYSIIALFHSGNYKETVIFLKNHPVQKNDESLSIESAHNF